MSTGRLARVCGPEKENSPKKQQQEQDVSAVTLMVFIRRLCSSCWLHHSKDAVTYAVPMHRNRL